MSRPHVICESCHAQQSGLFISANLLYCKHFRAMARRRRTSDKWTVDRNVSPDKAKAHLDAALARMADYCRARGIDLEDAMRTMQTLFETERTK